MKMKFKVAFTMDGETLFKLLGKVLPIEDLNVEEFIERPQSQPTVLKAHRVITGLKSQVQIAKPKGKRRVSKPLDLNAGINAVIMEAMAGGLPVRAVDLRPKIKARGFSENSVGSRLQNLREHGVVEQAGDGTWRLSTKTEKVA